MDIVLLQSGDKVPADLRLLHTKGLQIQESALTGESMAVESVIGEWWSPERQFKNVSVMG